MEKKQVEISDREYELLQLDPHITSAFEDVIESVVRDGENCFVSVTPNELTELVGYVAEEAVNNPDRRLKKELKTLAAYLKSI